MEKNCNCGTHKAGSATVSNPPKTSLTPFYGDTFFDNYEAKEVSVRNNWSGDIVISDIPAGSTVKKAFLYWMILNPTIPSGSGNFAGNPITGKLVGRDRDPCWGSDSSWAFRYDVTSWVSGNGTYDVNFSGGGGNYGEGASLVVFYGNSAEREQVFLIYNGNIFLASSLKVYTWTMQGFLAEATPQAKITYIVADDRGSGLPDSTFYDSSLVDWNTTQGYDGPYWDTRTYDVSTFTAGRSTQAQCKYAMGGQNNVWDCIMLEVCVLAVSWGPCPTGVEEQGSFASAQNDRLEVYPNPFTGMTYTRYGVVNKGGVSILQSGEGKMSVGRNCRVGFI